MKKNILYTIILSIGFILSSCSSWLDVTPPSQIREEDQFKTVEGFQQVLTGCYIGLTDEMLYGRVLSWSTVELMAGQFVQLPASTSNDYYMQAYNYTASTSLKVINQIWEKSYKIVANINNALKYMEINRGVLDDINYKIIKGELLSLRAMIHFDLMKLYGQSALYTKSDLQTRMTIPYVTTLSKEMTPQQSYTKTIELMVKDLNEAITLLEEDPITGKHPASYYQAANIDGFYSKRGNRMNYYAANLLLAKVYMWEGSSSSLGNAYQLARKVIDEAEQKGLVTWVNSTTVTDDMIMKAEHIFSLNKQNLIQESSNYFKLEIFAGTDVKAQYIPAARILSLYDAQGIGGTDFRFTKQFIQNTVVIDGQNAYTPLKYYGSSGTAITKNYIPLMRIPEAYYMAAECLVRQSSPNPSAAEALLNVVREKRGITSPLSGMSAGEIIDEIVKEYNKEYYCEGKMFFLYKRLGIENIPGYNQTADDEIYMLPYPSTEIQMGRKQ